MNLHSDVAGFRLYPGHLDGQAQQALLALVRDVLKAAPLFRPRMPKSGRPFTVRMSNCGPLGWVSDEAGYRYQSTHPDTGDPWPQMPAPLMGLWTELAGRGGPPEACLINFYDAGAKMGLHQDRDEADFDAPVISISPRRLLSVSARRPQKERADAVRPPELRRCRRSRRRRPACLSWSGSDLSGHIALAPGGRTDQSNAAPGHALWFRRAASVGVVRDFA
jgi:DNA alkylation damage repair protein AlkB